SLPGKELRTLRFCKPNIPEHYGSHGAARSCSLFLRVTPCNSVVKNSTALLETDFSALAKAINFLKKNQPRSFTEDTE
ncbi:MAG: hypothetical protein FWE09_08690, partial [Treponema sp.]|nr:hypothetical protein [Treponema sp.]